MKVVIYHGERVDFIGRFYQLFKDKAGKTYQYTGIKGVYVGDCYEINAKDQMAIRPKEVFDEKKQFKLTEKEWIECETQKVAVRASRLQKRKAMELKKPHADITRAVNLLRPFYQSVSRFDQERFVSYLQNEMSKKIKQKRRG